MLVPYPFSRALYVYGEPMRVARDADEGERERLRLVLENELNRLTDLADAELGVERVEPASVGETARGEWRAEQTRRAPGS